MDAGAQARTTSDHIARLIGFTRFANPAVHRWSAIRGLIAFSVATPLTMIVSYLLLDSAGVGVIALALLFSAGTFLYVATVDTLPAIHNPETGRRSVRNVVIGVVLLTSLVFAADSAGLLEHAH